MRTLELVDNAICVIIYELLGLFVTGWIWVLMQEHRETTSARERERGGVAQISGEVNACSDKKWVPPPSEDKFRVCETRHVASRSKTWGSGFYHQMAS